jgi:cytochrome c5
MAMLLLVAACGGSGGQVDVVAREGDTSLPVADRRLLVAATIALPPEGLVLESLPDPTGHGVGLLRQYCTQCHAPPSPTMHAAQDWPSVARRMWVRIDMMQGELGVASPTAAERIALLEYLLANALRVADRLPPGRGRPLFETICGRCHMLPDPLAHSPADWPAVVLRMERNMERMRAGGVSPEQTQQIVQYLEAASRR